MIFYREYQGQGAFSRTKIGEGLGPLKKLIRFDTSVILVAFFRTVS